MTIDLVHCVAFHGEPRAQRSEGVSAASAKGGETPPSIKKRSLIIGVTGGMASGKSTLARMIAGRGIAHVDADALVHQLMRDDADTIAAIGDLVPGVVANRRVDRAALATHIAKHPQTLPALEAILHPRVRALEEGAIAFARRNRLRAVVLDVPLMFETGADELCDIVIAAHAPIAQRRARAFRRAGMTQAKWNRLIARQWPDADRNALADIVISTGIGKAAMRRRIHALLCEWGLR